MELRLLSVNVGAPRVIGVRDGKPLLSAIGKQPVTAPFIFAGALGLAGDSQANTRVHGGPDKAVYAYPADHWEWWEKEKNFPCFPARFGENLTLQGAGETMVAIGDRFSWGEAVLEISQPRSPCNKFQTYAGRADAAALMTLSGRCGWYMRVIGQGEAPVRGALARIFASGGPDVRTAFFAAFDRRLDDARRAEIAAHPALAAAWRVRLLKEDAA